MRRLLFTIILVGGSAVALADDPHSEMAAALTAAIDIHPAPAVLPGTVVAPKTAAATPTGKKLPIQAEQARDQVAAGLARSAQGAAMSAAGQAQAAAAQQRAANHPHH